MGLYVPQWGLALAVELHRAEDSGRSKARCAAPCRRSGQPHAAGGLADATAIALVTLLMAAAAAWRVPRPTRTLQGGASMRMHADTATPSRRMTSAPPAGRCP